MRALTCSYCTVRHCYLIAHQSRYELLVSRLRRRRRNAVAVGLGRHAVVEELLVPALAVEACDVPDGSLAAQS